VLPRSPSHCATAVPLWGTTQDLIKSIRSFWIR